MEELGSKGGTVMGIYRVTETRTVSEWADVEADSRDEAIAAYTRREWIGDIGEEIDTEWDVEEVDDLV